MGLPRYRQDQLDSESVSSIAFCAGYALGIARFELCKDTEAHPDICLAKFFFRLESRRSMTGQYYNGFSICDDLDKRASVELADGRTVFITERLKGSSRWADYEARVFFDFHHKKYKYAEYKSRTFTGKLRMLIMMRDQHRCRLCGKSADSLRHNEHLEVDHIVSWSDGGRTTYKNGQTVCSTCNKGKFHAERELSKKDLKV